MKVNDLDKTVQEVVERTMAGNIESANREKMITESRVPCVGIFWFVDGDQLISDCMDIRDPNVTKFNGTIDYPKVHRDFWQMISRNVPNLKNHTWLNNLRGRVFYRIENDDFVVLTDKNRFTDEQFVIIRDEFNLPFKNITVIHNEHYEEGWKP